MEKINTPFSHTASVRNSPLYEAEVKYIDVYPQLPVLSHKGKYNIKDEDSQTVEEGKAKTVMHIYPTRKTRKDNICKKLFLGDEDSSGTDEAVGGYDPAIKRMLAKAEKRGKNLK